jgi:hypothetical protein
MLARAALLTLATSLSEPLEEPEWDRVRQLSAKLADLIEFGATDETLTSLAKLWAAHEGLTTLH